MPLSVKALYLSNDGKNIVRSFVNTPIIAKKMLSPLYFRSFCGHFLPNFVPFFSAHSIEKNGWGGNDADPHKRLHFRGEREKKRKKILFSLSLDTINLHGSWT
jgi:hypothetical protein